MNRNIKIFITELQHRIWYGTLIAALALFSGGMVAYEFFGENISEQRLKLMHDFDLVIAYFFLSDYLAGLFASPKRKKYIKEGWLDLLGSIPLSRDLFRALRLLRFARLVRLIRLASVGVNFRGGLHKISHHNDTDEEDKEQVSK